MNFDIQIPQTLKRRFASRLRMKSRVFATLEGVCETPQERDAMLEVERNGTRKLHVVERSVGGKGIMYGIYSYYE